MGKVPPISLVGVAPTHTVGDLARATFESTTHAIACNFARLDALAPTRPPTDPHWRRLDARSQPSCSPT